MEKPVKNIIHNWYMNPETGRITGKIYSSSYQDGDYIDTSPVEHFWFIPNHSHPWRAETRNSIYRLGLPLVLERERR